MNSKIIKKLDKAETKKGNYKREHIQRLLQDILYSKVSISCPKCNGIGREYGHRAFGESETTDCFTCNGTGEIVGNFKIKEI